jgi:peroxiredoxin
MIATFWLLGCVLAPAQATSKPLPSPAAPLRAGDWVLTPRLSRGQELVYRGTFTEQAVGTRVQFQRTYRVESRFFVLETIPRGMRLAALTTLQNRTARPAPKGVRIEPISSSVRLERLTIDLQCKIQTDPGLSATVPLDGPPTLEVGAFLETPRGRAASSQGWETVEPDRPTIAWQIAGSEAVNGQPCIKVVGVQQTEEWDRPRGDRGAWRRQDVVWISPRTGLTARVERTIEHREPACRETAQKSVLRYELESSMPLPGQLAQDRRQEILQTLSCREAAAPMLPAPGRYGKPLEALDRKIAYHLENQPTTPYREALVLVKRQVEAARRGEVAAVVHEESMRPNVAALGEAAPDFIAAEFTGKGSARLARWKGKPILLVFYQPSAYTAADVLRFAQEVHNGYGKYATVVGLSVSDNPAEVLKQRAALGVGFPLLHGGGMRISYSVETTPKMVLIDAAGVVRGAYVGWGRETAVEVLTELRRWLLVK